MFTSVTNSRRFRDADGNVLAIYDSCRSYTLYAFVGRDKDGNVCFVSAPRAYFPDQIEEIF